MNIYRSKKDGKIYILSKNSPPKYTGSWVEMARYDWFFGQVSPWKKVPQIREKDFYKICEVFDL